MPLGDFSSGRSDSSPLLSLAGQRISRLQASQPFRASVLLRRARCYRNLSLLSSDLHRFTSDSGVRLMLSRLYFPVYGELVIEVLENVHRWIECLFQSVSIDVWQLKRLGRQKPFKNRHKFQSDYTFVIFFFKLRQNNNNLAKKRMKH